MALELALLAPGGWETPGAIDEARALLSAPEAGPGEIGKIALDAAGAWSGRSEPARRLYAAWARMERADERASMLERDGQVGQLARMGLVGELCDSLAGSVHLPPAQAASLLARSAAVQEPVQALEVAGRALEGIQPVTLLGSHALIEWRELLAEARLPAPVPALQIPQAAGLPLEHPVAPLLRIEPEWLVLSGRGLVSWRDGQLVTDPGPPPERVERWSPSAWQRWQVIAKRRAATSLGGVRGAAARSVLDTAPYRPNLICNGDLPVTRLVEVMGWLHAEGVDELCLLVRQAEHESPRGVCAAFRPRIPAGGAGWSLGPGGLHSDRIPSAGADAWMLAEPGARVDDLVLALEEARHAGRRLGLAGGP